jgi:hypothetical protein
VLFCGERCFARVWGWGVRALFLLMVFDPAEFGEGKATDGVEAHPCGGGDADSARGWLHAEVDVFDVLAVDVEGEFVDLEWGVHGCLLYRRTEGRTQMSEPSVVATREVFESYVVSPSTSTRLRATRPVPGTGFEPVRPFGQQLRGLPRLPVPPAGPGSAKWRYHTRPARRARRVGRKDVG